MNLDKFTITSFDRMIGFDRITGDLWLDMDELTDFTLSQEEERVEITGKSGRVISILKRNKSVTGSGTNGFLSGGTLAAMVGDDIVTDYEDYTIRYCDTVLINGSTGTTSKTAVGTAGDEIGTIYVRNEDNAYITGGTKLTQVSGSPSSGEFSYDPDTNTIILHDGDVADGVEVVMFYDTTVNGAKITNDADKFSKVLSVYVYVTCQDMCDNIFSGVFIIERADFNGSFDITGGSDPSTQAFEFTSLPNLCTGRTVLWDFILFE